MVVLHRTCHARPRAAREQRGLEGAGDGRLALAGLHGVADHDDRLAGPRQRAELVTGAAAGPIIEPVAQLRQRKQLRHSGPAADAAVERGPGEGAEAEAVIRAGCDHDAIERCEHLRLCAHVGLEAAG